MILYHGSDLIVKEPKILQSYRLLDYGTGFYTTTSQLQAEMWVKRKLKRGKESGYVNCYEFGLIEPSKFSVLKFDEPSEDWLDFVMANRTDESYTHAYDIVIGPVANDKVYAAFALYESGVFNKTDLIRELKTYTLVDQVLFHTEQALGLLTFTEAIEIKR